MLRILSVSILLIASLSLRKTVAQTAPAVFARKATNTLSLEGIWRFKPDPFVTGVSSNGVQLFSNLPEKITLPGSTDQACKGYRSEDMNSLRLTRLFEYKGAAWYEKDVFIPAGWKGKEVRLFLERAHWETAVWINDHPVGKRESLSAPHVYDITAWLHPDKKNTVRIRVDNNLIYNIEYSHAASAETQTNWNGIIGRIELQALDKIHIDEVQVYPRPEQHSAECRITVHNNSKAPVKGILQLTPARNNLFPFAPVSAPFSGTDSLIAVSVNLPLGDKTHTWDEFDPALYRVAVQMQAEQEGVQQRDSIEQSFGLRTIGTKGTRFTVNGRESFIRGTVNSAEFPLTGYPPMDTAAWLHIFRVCRAYGLNAVRFHSWCPPEAAFTAADETGMYLQIENTDWRFTIGKDPAVNKFLTEEADRILRTYGNHPSFMMFCEGNELAGPSVNSFLSNLVAQWSKDPRHLYTGSSGYPVVPGNQYNDYYGARPQHWKEGLNGRFNAQPLNTQYDYSDYVKKFTIPMITHEIGQWCVYPDYDQIPKYTGVLRPYNYELFRESLREHHMAGLAKTFTLASGRFQVIQKKEEIESYLRTPGLGGYHLLQLNDFPGQGTAPVGVVDDFWAPKFYTDAKEFSRFQSARVLLLRTGAFTWTNDQPFTGDIELANFGSGILKKATTEWTLEYPDGRIYAQGHFNQNDIAVGSPIPLGHLRIDLGKIQTATALMLRVHLGGTNCSNAWEIWVYPKTLPASPATGFIVAYDWNDSVKQALRQGAKVLLLADTAKVLSDADPVFSGISWNTVWSGMPPNLLGILCDPRHPALRHFPTEFHSNWQWWDLVRHSKPMMLDSMPANFLPVVQMIPDWNNNKKIGLLWEAKVGKGSLLVAAIDLRHDMAHRPVAAQLLYSLEKYMAGEAFAPQDSLSMDSIDMLFKK